MSFSSTVLGLSPYSWNRLNDASGTVAADSSGNSRPGSYAGTVTLQSPSMTNDGTKSTLIGSGANWVNIPSGPSATGAAFTLGFILAPTSLVNVFICGSLQGSNSTSWWLQQTGSGITLSVNGSVVGSATYAAANFAVDVANFVWVDYDGAGNWHVSINGSAAIITVTGHSFSPAGGGTTEVGTYSNSNSNTPGYYQEVMQYSSVLSQSSRNSVYTASGLTNPVQIPLTNTLSVTSSATSNALTWTVPSQGTAPYSYVLYRGLISQVSVTGYTQIYSGTATSYTDTPPDGQLYYYRVVSTDSEGTPDTGVSNLQPAQLRPQLLVACIGDSRTLGVQSSTGYDPVTQLVTALNYTESPKNVTGLNLGQNGSATRDWQPTGTYLPAALTSIISAANALSANSAVYVQIMLGVNDGDQAVRTSVATWKQNIQNIITYLKNGNIPHLAGIILHSSFYVVPYVDSNIYDETGNGLVIQYNAAIASLVDNSVVFSGDMQSYDFFALNYAAYLSSDQLHPNNAGYTALADMWSQAYANILSGGSGFKTGTSYPKSIPIKNLISGNATVSVPWTIPASGIPGATGSVQSGSTTFSSLPQSSGELCNLLDRMVSDGRATIL